MTEVPLCECPNGCEKEWAGEPDFLHGRRCRLSAPPSQSESDDERAKKAFDLGRQYERAFAKLSPTPYVRPAAEIQAEIERLEAERKDIRHTEGAKIENKARIAGLTFALTPRTQEPR